MKQYQVISKDTGEQVYQYTAEAPIEWYGFPFDSFNHVEVPVVSEAPPSTVFGPHDTYIDIGPFFDRFGTAKMAILASSDAVVKAIVQDCTSRKWIDLLRPDVPAALDQIMARVPSVTAAIKSAVLQVPVSREENFALRKLYFNEVA